ncbi:hypothetical protein DV735_g1543, partial [Chaetothyriales sp. CBS 134920]
MEDGRHRQIAELLAEVRELSSEQQFGSGMSASSSGSSRKAKGKKKGPEEATTKADGDDPEEPMTPTPMNPLGQGNFSSTRSNDSNVDADVLPAVENLTINTNGDNNSSAARRTAAAVPPSPVSPAVATPSPKLTKAALRATKRAAKQAKSELKAAKNQTKHTVSVKSADVQFVAEVLHGKMGCNVGFGANGHAHTQTYAGVGGEEDEEVEEGREAEAEWNATCPPSRHPLPTDTCIEDVLKRNVGYVAWIREYNAELLKACPKKTKKGVIVDRKKAGGKKDAKTKIKDKEKSTPPPTAAVAVGGAAVKKKLAADGLADDGGGSEDAEGSSVDDMDALVDAILFKFGITDSSNSAAVPAAAASGFGATNAAANGFGSSALSHGSMSSAQAAILARLRVEIADDLQKHENEQRMTCMRAGGFWSYAGKGVFDRMTMLDQDKEWKAGAGDGSRAARQDNGPGLKEKGQ